MKFVQPYNERNAIKNVAFALEFKEEAEESLIQSLIALYQETEHLNTTLPRKQVHSTTLYSEIPSIPTTSKNLGGVTFDRLTPKGIPEWSIFLGGNVLVINCGDYTRWDKVWVQAKKYLNIVLPLLSEKTFSLIALEYIDKFLISDITEGKWQKELFKNDSKYLPSNIYTLEEPWHSRHGFFLKKDNEIGKIILNNIDVDYLIGHEEDSLLMMRTQHKTELQTLTKYNNNFLKNVELVIRESHDINKGIMKNILSKGACSEIDLEV
jgi:uncharacterized protein (TIGR04255 family)